MDDFSFSDLSSLLKNRCEELSAILKEPNEENDLIKGINKKLMGDIWIKKEKVAEVLSCINSKLNKYTGI